LAWLSNAGPSWALTGKQTKIQHKATQKNRIIPIFFIA
jgi:hypothetical protein